MTSDLNFKNKYFKYKLKYYKLKQLGGMFPVVDDYINPQKLYYIKNVETKSYLRYSTTSDTLSLGTNESSGRKFKFIYASKQDCYRIESQSKEANKKVISYNASNQGILEKNKSGVKNQVFKITKNPVKECFKIVNCYSLLSLEIREDNIRFAEDRDNSNRQCFILEEVPTAPQPSAQPPKYDPHIGIIRDDILLQIIQEQNITSYQLNDSAMVWGALNRARDRVPGLSRIEDKTLIRYITENDIIRNRETDRERACEFVRRYVQLSKNEDFVNTASRLLDLDTDEGGGGGTAP